MFVISARKNKMSQHWVETLQGNNYSIRYMFFCIWLWGVALPASRIPDQHLALQIGSERRGHSLVHQVFFFTTLNQQSSNYQPVPV